MLLYIFQMRWKKFNVKKYTWPFSYCPCYQHETLISAPRALARETISVEGWWQGQYEKRHVLIYVSHILPGQKTCYCPRKMLLPRRLITRRKLCFYYTCKFGVISIKYVIKNINRISSFDESGDLSMSVGNNIIDGSCDLIISVGHNITYLSIKYYPDYLIWWFRWLIINRRK